jgi:hypothetical protein
MVMIRWLRLLRGALGMGVTWAVAWALGVVVIGISSIFLPGLEFLFEAADDELLPLMIVSGFAGGIVFSTVLGIAGRRRRFDELSLPQFAAWGAMGGVLLTVLPAVGGTASAGVAAAVMGTASLLSAISAAGSLKLARMGEDRALLDASEEVAEVGLSEVEVRELLGRGD